MASQSPGKPDASRSWLQRLVGRIRYGLLTQELLSRIASSGIVVFPYFVVSEPPADKLEAAPADGLSVRLLTAHDAAAAVGANDGQQSAQRFVENLASSLCLGIFHGDALAGYTCAAMDVVPMPSGTRQAVFTLQPDEAYLFGMHIARRHRGLRLAGFLRQAMQRELFSYGRRRFYSVTAAFNRSSRRFKSRLGARELELRIYLHLRLWSLPGCDLRIWRQRPHLPSVRVRCVPAVGKARSNG
jgi:hypothetical protein